MTLDTVQIYWHGELEAWVYDVPGQGCAKAADLIAHPPRGARQSVDGLCDLCGQPMPPGEEMFRYHGYSGPCPAPPHGAGTGDDDGR